MSLISSVRSLKAILILFSLSIITPATAALGGLIVWNVVDATEARESELLAQARAVSGAVDLRIVELASSATAIATSESLSRRDWPAVSERVDRLDLGDQVWIAISDRQGRRLLNTSPEARPQGQPLLPRPASITKAVESGVPEVSNLFQGSSTGRLVVAVDRAVPSDPDQKVVSLVTSSETITR